MKKTMVLFVFMITAVLIVSLGGAYADSQASVDSPQKKQDATPGQDASSLSGKVVESMDSGGYTYINVEKDGRKTWVAVTQTKVNVGQNISFKPGTVMSNFTSKTLNRTFESIIFSGGIIGQNDGASPGATAIMPAGHKHSTVPADKSIKVERASGPDAYTVAELYEKSAALDKKSVVVRGKVVKFSSEIMGKNWIHIQDGSGDPSKGTNDILITSQDVLSVGDIVIVKGTLFKDKDFGSGYKYAVIVEEASIKK